jgi:hypothetical protein
VQRFYHFTRTREALPLDTELKTLDRESEHWKYNVSEARSLLGLTLQQRQGPDELSRVVADLGLPKEVALQIDFGERRARMVQEILFEQVRADEFPHQPSRSRCMYMFDTSIDPGEYRDQVKLGNRAQLCEIEIIDGTLHHAPLDALDCVYGGYRDIITAATYYWHHSEDPGVNSEVLFIGSFRVVRFLDEP